MSRLLCIMLPAVVMLLGVTSRLPAQPDGKSGGKDLSPTQKGIVDAQKDEEILKLKKLIQELKAKLNPVKISPNRCIVSAQVQGDVVKCKATYRIQTIHKRQYVLLGFKQSHLTGSEGAEFGANLSFPKKTSEGYVIQVEKVGVYEFSLAFETALVTDSKKNLTGADQFSFSLQLPRASITHLTLRFRKPVRTIQLNGQDKESDDGQPASNWVFESVPSNDLRFAWHYTSKRSGVQSQLTADWLISVRLLPRQAVTTAKLILKDSRKKKGMQQWRVVAPELVELKIENDSEQLYSWKRDPKTGLVVITGPPTTQLKLKFTEIKNQPIKRHSVGPFIVVEAKQQQAIFEVYADKRLLRDRFLRYYEQANLQKLNLPEDTLHRELRARFNSWNLTEGMKPSVFTAAARIRQIKPPLQLELRQVASLVETSVDHEILVLESDDKWGALCTSRIHITPLRGGIEYIDLRLPGLHPVKRKLFSGQPIFPANLVDAVTMANLEDWLPVRALSHKYRYGSETQGIGVDFTLHLGENKARVYLQKERKPVAEPFTFYLISSYSISPYARKVRLPLPIPISLRDKGGNITIKAEPGLELISDGRGADSAGLPQIVMNQKRSPPFVDVSWRRFQPRFPVVSTTDVTFEARHGLVSQELKFDFSKLPSNSGKNGSPQARRIQLYVPSGILKWDVAKGGKLREFESQKRLATIEMSPEEELLLQYHFPLTTVKGLEKGGQVERDVNNNPTQKSLQIPLIWPVNTSQVQYTVRLWTQRGVVPSIPAGAAGNERWRDIGVGSIPRTKDELPSWTLRTEYSHAPLTVLLPAAANNSVNAILIEKALIQVHLLENGAQRYKARFLFNRLNADQLDITFPAPVVRIKPEIEINGKKINWTQTNSGGNVARISGAPLSAARNGIVEIGYEIRSEDAIDFKLQPPYFGKDVPSINGIYWHITYSPAHTVPLLAESYECHIRWGWHGWLLTPQSDTTKGNLEKWPASALAPGQKQSNGLVFWTGSVKPVNMMTAPRNYWILLCSGLLLIAGLGTIVRTRLRFLLWILLFVLVLSLIAARIVWPMVFHAILYGLQPGVVILLIILLVHWILQRRHNYRLTHLPSFTPVKPTSALTRTKQPQKRAPSTIDAVLPSAGRLSSAGKEGTP